MNADSWIILALVVADLCILVGFYFDLRAQAPLDQRPLFRFFRDFLVKIYWSA